MSSFIDLPHKDKNFVEKIEKLFNQQITNITDLNEIFFQGKTRFFDIIDKNYKKEGEEFVKIFNNLKELILNIENILIKPEIPLLKTGTRKINLKLTRKEVALLFILSFFNLINLNQKNLSSTNLFSVYEVVFFPHGSSFEFGRCFLNYLTIIGTWLSENNPILDEKIVYIRGSINFDDEIFKKETKLCDIKIYPEGSLFDGNDSYFVDFANMYIGGGVLNGGNVQEEILFAVQPEAIVSMLFMEVMNDNDAIRIDNTIVYSEYSGYGGSFKFAKSAINLNDLNSIKRNKFIAIDASARYQSQKYEYDYRFGYGYISKKLINRDLHKAFVGFNLINFYQKEKDTTYEKIPEDTKIPEEENKDKNNIDKKSIATGNWGCGIFGGDHELKFFQQWIAASFAGVERLDYFSFGAKEMLQLTNKLDKIKQKYINANKLYEDLITKKLSEGEVLNILLN